MQVSKIKLDPWFFQQFWPSLRPFFGQFPCLAFSGRQSPETCLALSWSEIDATQVIQNPLPQTGHPSPTGFGLGRVVLVPYDIDKSPSATPLRAFALHQALVLRSADLSATLYQDDLANQAQYRFPFTAWLEQQPQAPLLAESQGPSCQWIPTSSRAQHQAQVEKVIADIRRGRFYQLNLLRYWQAKGEISAEAWLSALQEKSGPYGALLALPDLSLISFSPERFLHIHQHQGQTVCDTMPIKGTRPRSDSPEEDARLREELLGSAKDQAELAMIVDLLRNDLYALTGGGDVKVLDPGSLFSFATVHHRIAQIRAILPQGLSLHDVLQAMCPGGSITGAPKREVRLAIAELEGRSRGYFMGNLMFINEHSGRIDSSILIRTAVKLGQQNWECAAGSGLVIGSNPYQETLETEVKASLMPGWSGFA